MAVFIWYIKEKKQTENHIENTHKSEKRSKGSKEWTFIMHQLCANSSHTFQFDISLFANLANIY